MSRSTRSYDTIVLLTRDIGEADRFCILFTREGGKRAARARGVRKTGSRLGGLLLPMRHLHLELEERGEFATIPSARDRDVSAHPYSHVATFSVLTQGTELLLRLTEDQEPLPGVFDLFLEFRDAAVERLPDPLLPFQLRLLQELGHLPVTAEDSRVARLTPLSQSFLWSCARHRPLKDLCAMPTDRRELRVFCDQVVQEHLTRPLNAPVIAAAMQS